MQGTQRVIIEKITPDIDAGRFAAKSVKGQKFTVEADIFLDGHDLISARIEYKHVSDANWSFSPLFLLNNDRWSGNFITSKTGFYEYTIRAWVDHAATWQYELPKRIKDGQDINMQLLIGVSHLEEMMNSAIKTDLIAIKSAIKLLKDKKNYTAAVEFSLGSGFSDLVNKYPFLKHASVFNRQLFVLVDRKTADFSTWYSLFPRSTSATGAHGTFKDTIALLPRIADLGFDVLYIPPIHPIGFNHRKGKNNAVSANENEPGVPYAIGSKDGGHKDILKELGTIKDFKELVQATKNAGMELAMDYALQCSPDHPYVKQNPQWFRWRPDGSVQYAENPPKKYQDILPINFECDDWVNLWEELKSILIYWVDHGVKIFRVDNPHTKPFIFWEWVIAEVKNYDSEVLFLSEAFTKPKVMQQLAKCGFSQSYTYYTWRNSKYELMEYMTELTTSEMKNYFRPNFWTNTHDINPYILQAGNEATFLTRFFMAATLTSNYGIFGPCFELMEKDAIPGKEEYLNSEKYEVRQWDWKKSNKLMYIIKMINKIRKENPALQQTNNFEWCEIKNDELLAYLKYDDAMQNYVLMVVNINQTSRQQGFVNLPSSKINRETGVAFQVHDLITGSKYTWNDGNNYVELDPNALSFHLFRVEPLS